MPSSMISSSVSSAAITLWSMGLITVIAVIGSFNLYIHNTYHTAFAVPHTLPPPSLSGPTIVANNTHLKVETVFKGLRSPTSMAFLGPNDILVLEKNRGTVQRIVNGNMLVKPLLKVAVATNIERGMLGIAISKTENQNKPTTYVFLYYTQSGGGKTGDDKNTVGGTAAGIPPLGNRLYRYELINNQLVNPKLLLSLPAIPANPASSETNHNGGKVVIGPDRNVYSVIGDVGSHRGQAQNTADGAPLDGTGGILRVTGDGQPVANAPLGVGATIDNSSVGGEGGVNGNSTMSKFYYAYGIRNSFGMGFDPITGKLWDTENGPSFGDEINLVDPGFNSGWTKIQGVWQAGGESSEPGPIAAAYSNNLVDFGRKGVYRDPEFTWLQEVAPTALTFLNSSKLGKQYENDMFVSDILNGNIYHFKLNHNRTGLLLTGSLADKVANNPQEIQQLVFARGFGGITDIQTGPGDGYLYVLSYTGGAIYRIVPSD